MADASTQNGSSILHKYPRAVAALLYGRTDVGYILPRVLCFVRTTLDLRNYESEFEDALSALFGDGESVCLGDRGRYALHLGGYESIHANLVQYARTGQDTKEFLLLSILCLCHITDPESLGVQGALLNLPGFCLRCGERSLMPLLHAATYDFLLSHYAAWPEEALFAHIGTAVAACLPPTCVAAVRAVLDMASHAPDPSRLMWRIQKTESEHRASLLDMEDWTRSLWPQDRLDVHLALVRAEWERVFWWLAPLRQGVQGVETVMDSSPRMPPLAVFLFDEPWSAGACPASLVDVLEVATRRAATLGGRGVVQW